jgi:hypothetical protein
MAQKTAARGRPKGTGVDDAGALMAIADIMAANPGMKTTTAIKALGISNPSVVRRLRDKYQQLHAHRDAKNAGRTTNEPRPEADNRQANNVISLRTRSRTKTVPDAPAQRPQPPAERPAAETAGEPAPAADDHPARASSKPAAAPDLFAAAYAASVATTKTAIHVQFKALWYAFQVSPYACAVRGYEFQRLLLNSLAEKAQDPRSSRPED